MVQEYSVLQELERVSFRVEQFEGEHNQFPDLVSEHVGLQNVRVLSVFLVVLRLVRTVSHVLRNLQKLYHHFECCMKLFVLDGFLRDLLCCQNSTVHCAKQEVKRIELQTTSDLTDVNLVWYFNRFLLL